MLHPLFEDTFAAGLGRIVASHPPPTHSIPALLTDQVSLGVAISETAVRTGPTLGVMESMPSWHSHFVIHYASWHNHFVTHYAELS
jgi:hypothetical protein